MISQSHTNLAQVFSMYYYVGAILLALGHLHDGSRERHHHGYRYLQQVAVVGQGQGMVASRRCYDTLFYVAPMETQN